MNITDTTLMEFWNSRELETTLDNAFVLNTIKTKPSIIRNVLYAVKLYYVDMKVNTVSIVPTDDYPIIQIEFETETVDFCKINIQHEYMEILTLNGERIKHTSKIYF